jgi:hypothetical protein
VSLPGAATVTYWSSTAGTVGTAVDVPNSALQIIVNPTVFNTRWYATVRINNVSFTV